MRDALEVTQAADFTVEEGDLKFLLYVVLGVAALVWLCLFALWSLVVLGFFTALNAVDAALTRRVDRIFSDWM